MAGDASNAALWQNADVYIAPLGTAGPTDLSTAWAAAWKPVGLLDGAEGFTESRSSDSTEHYAWGGALVKRTVSKHERTIKFVALEDNEVVFDLVNPGSDRTVDGVSGMVTKTVKTPIVEEFAIGFEARDGNKVSRRIVGRASVKEVDDVKMAEEDLTVYAVTVILYPASDSTLYIDLTGEVA